MKVLLKGGSGDLGRRQFLQALGVLFTQPPTSMGSFATAVFDDTCGNLIQIASLQAT